VVGSHVRVSPAFGFILPGKESAWNTGTPNR
jgi:hypothetical protein